MAKKSAKPTKSVTVRLTTDVVDACQRIADADERSLTFVVQKALEAYVASHNVKKSGK
jgi:predicted transcriptional regulator